MAETLAEKCAKAFEAAAKAEKPISYDQAVDLVELVCENGAWLAQTIRESNPYNKSDD